MTKYIKLTFFVAVLFFSTNVFAGNNDRVGQAGASELLVNPWARSSGMMGLNTAGITGVEAMRFNAGGLAFTGKTEIVFASTIWLSGSEIYLNALGFSQKLGDAGVLGLTLMSTSFGEIPITTEDSPDYGSGSTYRPTYLNIGLAYAKSFSESIHGGVVIRLINHSLADISDAGVAFDTGIQYVTGKKKQIKFGIALRNVGTPMKFGGDGLSVLSTSATGFETTLAQKSEKYELPTLLNIGATYDFYMKEDKHRITVATNYTSNSFRKDNIGGGVEYSFKDIFSIRGGFNYEKGIFDDLTLTTELTGFSGGVSVDVPLKAGGPTIGIDYSYRTTNIYAGIHSFGLKIAL